MAVVAMMQGADDAESAGLCGQQWQSIADPESGNGRVDDTELAADGLGSLGLGVERLVVRRTAVQEEHDARGFGSPAGIGSRLQRRCCSGQAQ